MSSTDSLPVISDWQSLAAQVSAAGFHPEEALRQIATLVGDPISVHAGLVVTDLSEEFEQVTAVYVVTRSALVSWEASPMTAEDHRQMGNHTEDRGDKDSMAFLTARLPWSQAQNMTVAEEIVEDHLGGGPADVIEITVDFAGSKGMELIAYECGDEECTANHGFELVPRPNGVVIRVKRQQHGADALEAIRAFAAAVASHLG